MKKNKKLIIGIATIPFLIITFLIVDHFLNTAVKPRVINENGFQAHYFTQEITNKKTTIILIGGGQWGDYWGQQFAQRGFVGLSLAYANRKGLPKLPEEIDLEYFEHALLWLNEQPEVDSNKIIVMGASRNAELALVIASVFPNLVSGVIAYAPSSVSWSNTVLPYNSNKIKPSWKYQGHDIPYISMDKFPGNESDKIETLGYWKSGLAKTNEAKQAAIQVEKINGPILLFSGLDDQVWPSAQMADMMEQRIKEYNFQYAFDNLKYENAGHQISGNPETNSDIRTGKIHINGKEYEYQFGGTNEGDRMAKQDAKIKLLDFLEKM